MRLFEVVAKGTTFKYYVEAKSTKDAKRRFKNRMALLNIQSCDEVTDKWLIEDIKENPDEYIVV